MTYNDMKIITLIILYMNLFVNLQMEKEINHTPHIYNLELCSKLYINGLWT